jgi:hypothetical protein
LLADWCCARWAHRRSWKADDLALEGQFILRRF